MDGFVELRWNCWLFFSMWFGVESQPKQKNYADICFQFSMCRKLDTRCCSLAPKARRWLRWWHFWRGVSISVHLCNFQKLRHFLLCVGLECGTQVKFTNLNLPHYSLEPWFAGHGLHSFHSLIRLVLKNVEHCFKNSASTFVWNSLAHLNSGWLNSSRNCDLAEDLLQMNCARPDQAINGPMTKSAKSPTKTLPWWSILFGLWMSLLFGLVFESLELLYANTILFTLWEALESSGLF